MARAELKVIQGQQAIAEYGIELLSGVAAELGAFIEAKLKPGEGLITPTGTITAESITLSALVALCCLRLSELQTAATSNAERIAQLEAFLKQADSRVVVPNLQV